MKFKMTIVVTLTLFCLNSNSAIAQNCEFPSLEQLKHLNALGGVKENFLITGKVINIKRMPLREQRPITQIGDHSSDYFRFVAKVVVTDNIIKMKNASNPVRGEQINIALETSSPWDNDEHPYRKLLLFSSPRRINYLIDLLEYVFCLNLEAGYRYTYGLYTPKGAHFTRKCGDWENPICKPPEKSCDNFYVWPMPIFDDQVVARVQFYGSDKIIEKKFKYEEFVNLYK